MPNHCMVPRSGTNVSRSNERANRRFMPNIQHERHRLPSENRYARLTVSAHGMRAIDARRIERVIRVIRACRIEF